jgi:hypothetical protein
VGLLCGLAALAWPAAGAALAAPQIYWANSLDNSIGAANLDGTVANQSLITGANQPDGVAVDGDHVYWTNGGTGTIGEANLDGTGVNQNFITGADFPEGVAVDGQHVYWANSGGNTIGEANLDGTGINENFITGAAGPLGVAVDGQHVYWANSGTGTIGEANLDGTSVNQNLIASAFAPVMPAVSVPVARVSPAAPAAFASTPQGSLSAPLTLTVTNAGQRALSLTGLSFAGADPGDFLVGSDTCLGSVDPGNSCRLGLYFSPEGPGARTATLQMATTDYANSPLAVTLSGTGDSLPTGPTGPPGAAGSPGAAGKVELITCKTVRVTVTRKIKGKRRKVRVNRQKCTGKLVSGTVTFTVGGAAAQATISRAHSIYATGVSIPIANGSSQLVLTDLRPLPHGRYTLTQQSRHGRRSINRRTQITIR